MIYQRVRPAPDGMNENLTFMVFILWSRMNMEKRWERSPGFRQRVSEVVITVKKGSLPRNLKMFMMVEVTVSYSWTIISTHRTVHKRWCVVRRRRRLGVGSCRDAQGYANRFWTVLKIFKSSMIIQSLDKPTRDGINFHPRRTLSTDHTPQLFIQAQMIHSMADLVCTQHTLETRRK